MPRSGVLDKPFGTDSPANTELALVEVSDDGTTWHEYPHSIGSGPLIDPDKYAGFAGVTPRSKGGDRFDLAEVIAAYTLSSDYRACYLRLTDGGTLYPDYGNTQSDLWASGADIDAVQVLHSAAATGLVDP